MESWGRVFHDEVGRALVNTVDEQHMHFMVESLTSLGRVLGMFQQLPTVLQLQWALFVVLLSTCILLLSFHTIPGVKFVLKIVVGIVLYLTMLLRYGVGSAWAAYVTYLTHYGNLKRALFFFFIPLLLETFFYVNQLERENLGRVDREGWLSWGLRKLLSLWSDLIEKCNSDQKSKYMYVISRLSFSFSSW